MNNRRNRTKFRISKFDPKHFEGNHKTGYSTSFTDFSDCGHPIEHCGDENQAVVSRKQH